MAGRPAVAADVFSGPSPASPVYEPVPRPHQGQQVPSPWVQQGNGGPQRGPRHAAASGSLQRQLSGSSGSRQQAGSGSRQGAQPAAAWHQQQAQQQPQAGQRQPPGHMQPPPHQPALYSPHNLSDCVISSKDLVEAVPIELALQSESLDGQGAGRRSGQGVAAALLPAQHGLLAKDGALQNPEQHARSAHHLCRPRRWQPAARPAGQAEEGGPAWFFKRLLGWLQPLTACEVRGMPAGPVSHAQQRPCRRWFHSVEETALPHVSLSRVARTGSSGSHTYRRRLA